MRLLPLSLSILVLASTSVVAQTPAAPTAPPLQVNYEIPPMFEASRVLPAEWIVGPSHRVRELTPSDGFLLQFTIDSDFGTFECLGRRGVNLRIQEIEAISKLVKFSKSDLFAQGLRKSVEAPIDAAKNIVRNPIQSVKQAPQTVGHFFNQIGSSVGSAVRGIGDKKPQSSGGEAENKQGLVRSIAGVAGFDKAKLSIARQLNIDPYSDNARLQEEMEKVTWALFAGGLPMDIGIGAVSSGASLALSATEFVGLPQEIYEVTPKELAFRDRKSLEAMGADVATIDRIIGNASLIPSMRHHMINSIQTLGRVEGQRNLINLLAVCEDSHHSYFLKSVLQLMVKRHNVQPYVGYGVYGRLPAGMTADGIMEVCTPVDYVSWTDRVAAFALRSDLGNVPKRLVLEGLLSPRTEAEMVAAGWEILSIQ